MNVQQLLGTGLQRLSATGVGVPDGVAARLASYVALLDKWNRVYNLTAIRDPARMISHHVLDSLAVLPFLERGRVATLLDVGTGAGLPGIPLALARPGWEVTLLDSNHKKTAFLQQALVELGISNARIATARVEALPATSTFDVVISRAFADLATFADAGGRLLGPGGRLVAMKGVYPHEELEQVPASVRVVDTPAVSVPGMDAERHLVILAAA